MCGFKDYVFEIYDKYECCSIYTVLLFYVLEMERIVEKIKSLWDAECWEEKVIIVISEDMNARGGG